MQLDLAKIEAFLTTRWLARANNEVWETIDSTNNRAIQLARSASAHGTAVIAGEQTAGRGRSGNAWLSPAGTGIYMSFILRPKLDTVTLPVVTLITGVAVVQAVQNCLSIKLGLKWVNDLISNGKKVGGILAEYQRLTLTTENLGRNSDTKGALIIGIGLNLYKPDKALPPELENKMGFLELSLSSNQEEIDKNKLVASIANALEGAIEQMESNDLSSLLNFWRAYSITLGEEIVASVGDKQIKGLALDINASGELLVKTPAGNVILSAGEISIRKANGAYV